MATPEARADVLVVPVIDVNWLVYAPFDPARDFRIDPPRVKESVGETRLVTTVLAELTGGKALFTPHSGTYCRTGYFEEPMLAVYREALAGGAELGINLHEEIKGAGTRYHERAHVEAMLADCQRRLRSAGIEAVAYRGGHYAYAPFMNEVLPAHGIFIDCSSAPGADFPEREAIWKHGETSGHYLPENPRLAAAGQQRSRVFEIPIGSDGKGAAYRNILHVEQSDAANLKRVWNAVRDRAVWQARSQIVHLLFHTGSVAKSEWLDRFRETLAWIPGNGGAFVNATEAKRAFDAGAREAAA
jgi:hypothetical protein